MGIFSYVRLNLSPILRKGCDMGIFSRRRRGFTSVEDEGVIAVPACTVEKLRKKLSKLFLHFYQLFLHFRNRHNDVAKGEHINLRPFFHVRIFG